MDSEKVPSNPEHMSGSKYTMIERDLAEVLHEIWRNRNAIDEVDLMKLKRLANKSWIDRKKVAKDLLERGVRLGFSKRST